MKNSTLIFLFLIGFIVVLHAILTPGLWPWQLPASFIGGGLIGFSLMGLVEKTRK